MSKAAQKKSFSLVSETCPAIDDGLSALEKIIKDATGSLRDALTEAADELLNSEQRISYLEMQLDRADERIAELELMLEAKGN